MKRILVACLLIGCGKGGNEDKSFDPYIKKGKANEAALRLNSIAKKAKAVAAETGKFPIGTSAVLPARNGDTNTAGGCCGSKSAGATDHKCPMSTAWASDPVWKALELAIDEPSNYRYKYESSDGRSFIATATGDLDCDGDEAMFTVNGTIDASGNPSVVLTPPPKDKY